MKQNTIQLLLINQSKNNAVETSNLLRNSGLTLRPKIISDSESLEQDFNTNQYDIILFSDNVSRLSSASILRQLKAKNSDAAFIVLADKTPQETIRLMKQGVTAVVAEQPEQLIELTVKKEIIAVHALRSKKILQKKITDSENRCQNLINSSRDAIAYIHEGMHILSNVPYYKMFGYGSRDDVEAMPVMDLVACKDSHKLKETLRYYAELDKTKIDEQQAESANENILSVTGIKDDETEFQMKMEFQPATMEGEDCIQIIIRNEGLSQKDQQKFQAKLAILHNQCQETGLYNRRYFLESLKKTVEDAVDKDTKASLFFITLDNFSDIKNTVGDIGSDQVIVDIADLIKNTIDDDIFLARFESYRFCAIVSTEDEQYALKVAEQIRTKVEAHIAGAKHKSIATTCSIGVMHINSSNNGTQSCLTYVQKACNSAIQKGGNQVQVYTPNAKELDEKQRIRYWNNVITSAIKQKRMYLVFQPFVSLQADSSENFEIFIRLRNDKGDTIFPREFLPSAEASNYSIHIDRWIVADAIRILSEREKAGYHNHFIIKLTSAALMDKQFAAWVQHNIKRFSVNPQSLIFQPQIQHAAESLRQTQHLSKQLHQIGCQFSLEHFGHDKNAFTILKHINVDFLKLDNSLVENISSNVEKLAELTQVCEQASELGIKTIVPFVEEAGSLSVIWQSGAHFIQGAFLQEASTSLDFDFSSFS